MLSHKELVNAAYKWVLKNGSCGVAFRELYTINQEYADVIGFGGWDHSVLLECKISRNDFLADKKKNFRKNPALGMGTHRYYVSPEGLIEPEDVIPMNWGLLWVNEKGKCRVIYKNLHTFKNDHGNEYRAIFKHEKNVMAERAVMYSALRRLHLRGHIEEIYKTLENETSN